MIDFETERLGEMRELIRKAEEQARQEGRENGPRRRTLLRDRDKPDHYIAVLEFDSYEEAMANSSRPETTALAEPLGKLTTRPRIFTNCDIVDQKEL